MKNIIRIFWFSLFLTGCHSQNSFQQLNSLNMDSIPMESYQRTIRYFFPMRGILDLNIPRNGSMNMGVQSNCILILSGKPEDNNRKPYKVICYKSFPKNVVTPLGCVYLSTYQSKPRIKDSVITHYEMERGREYIESAVKELENIAKDSVSTQHEIECRPEYIERAVKELEAQPDLEDIAVDYSAASENKKKVYVFIYKK